MIVTIEKSKKLIATAENYVDFDHYQRLLDKVFALNHTKVILKTSYTIFIPHQTLRISKHSVLQTSVECRLIWIWLIYQIAISTWDLVLNVKLLLIMILDPKCY